MAEDTQTVRFDPTNSFDVLQRLGGATDRLGQSGSRIGEGFIRGDRVVRTATANITRSLLTAGSAADVAGTALEGLERVFKIGILPTVAVAAGVATFIALKRQVDAADESVSKLTGDLAAISRTGGPEQLTASITRLTAEVEDASQKIQGPGPQLASFLDKFVNPLLGTSSKGTGASQNAAIAAGIRGIIRLSQQRAFVEDALNASRRAGIQGQGEALKLAERQAEADERSIKLGEKLAAIDEEEKKSKLALFAAAKKGIITALNRDLLIGSEAQLAKDRKQSAIEEAAITEEKVRQTNLNKDLQEFESKRLKALHQQQTEAQSATSFFEDLGSGKLRQTFQQEQQRKANEAAGRDAAKILQDAQEKGILSNDPFTQFAVKEADRLAARQGKSVTDLANTDFSNLLELSKYDFSGLQPLNGLTLHIQ